MHGGAFALARQAAQACAVGPGPQVLFAGSMLDLPAYLALAPPAARGVPVLYYFHENQLTYPLPPGVERDLGYAMKQTAGALAADRVCFNSAFHRREFLQAFAELLPLLPDEAPDWALARLEASAVLPLGCDLRRFDRHRAADQPGAAPGRWGQAADGPLILWNQRWEYDKAPGDFFAALFALQERGRPFRVAVAGPNRGLPSAVFVEARERLGTRIVQWGGLDDFADYAALLWEADIVVSTALHEFFGLAVVEALYCGCRPVLPDRLSYPELIPAEVRPKVLYQGAEGLVRLLERAVVEPLPWSTDWQRTWVSPYDWAIMAGRYDDEVWACWEAQERESAWTV